MILQAFFNALHALGSLPLPLQLGLVGCIIAAGLVLIKQYLKRQHHDQLPRGYRSVLKVAPIILLWQWPCL
jgi:ubiquinone biosynthesis protein Coq4